MDERATARSIHVAITSAPVTSRSLASAGPSAAGHLAAGPARRHAGDVLERAAAAHDQAGSVGRDRVGDGSEHVGDVSLEPAPVPLAQRVGLDDVNAYYDGTQVQVLILVRDDFWRSVSRLLADADVELDNSNSALKIAAFVTGNEVMRCKRPLPGSRSTSCIR